MTATVDRRTGMAQREWFCFEHGRVHADAEQAVYCQDGEWHEKPEPERSEFAKRWEDVSIRARGQHPDQVMATIRALGTCDRRGPADPADPVHPPHFVVVFGMPVHPPRPRGVAGWRARRACRRSGGHWWHPVGTSIDWFCCQCGTDRDGMPKDGS
jgi:hypothetical protein